MPTYSEYESNFQYSSKNLNYINNIEYYRDICYDESEEEKKRSIKLREQVNNEGRLNVHNKRLVSFESEELMNCIAPNYFELRTAYPGLLVGTGLPHSFGGKGEAELGLMLDYVTGMPYIPGSSVKGALRSAFVHEEYIRSLLETEKVTEYDKIKISELEAHIFGNPVDKKKPQFDVSLHEQDIFYDAVVVSEGKILATDSITPHRTNPELLELAAPNPITMIRIRPDVTFKFQFQLTDYEKDEIKITAEQKLGLFKQILIDLGIGAKTNVGYGTLEETVSVEKSQEEILMNGFSNGIRIREPRRR